MSLFRVVLCEDDCAPDAMEYFNKDVKEKTGMDLNEFKRTGEFYKSDGGMCLNWTNGKYLLEYCGDNPFYELSEAFEENHESKMGY